MVCILSSFKFYIHGKWLKNGWYKLPINKCGKGKMQKSFEVWGTGNKSITSHDGVLFSTMHFYAQQLMHCFSSFCNRQSLKIWPAATRRTWIGSHLIDVKLIVRATKPLVYVCEEGLGRNVLSNLLYMLLCTCSCIVVISLIREIHVHVIPFHEEQA